MHACHDVLHDADVAGAYEALRDVLYHPWSVMGKFDSFHFLHSSPGTLFLCHSHE